MYISKTGCDIGFYGENCTQCPENCLNDECHFQIGHCFDCKDGLNGQICEGMQMWRNLMLNETLIFPLPACLKPAKIPCLHLCGSKDIYQMLPKLHPIIFRTA